MTIPGNPMFFVNREFCRVTGYTKDEAHGRNCRFLQGPMTEPESVATIVDSLRRGVDCHVKITNYRKSGDTFVNLLTMRPVHDSNGVYRFCIGLQLEATYDARGTLTSPDKTQISHMAQLILALPTMLLVTTTKPTFNAERFAERKEPMALAEVEAKLESLLAPPAVGPPSPVAVDQVPASSPPTGFANNHASHLKKLGLEASWNNRVAMPAQPQAIPPVEQTVSTKEAIQAMLLVPAADPQIQAMASSLGLQPPTGDGWTQQFESVAEQLPHAILVVDVTVPGMRIAYANYAAEQLVGYTKEEHVGKNCKFLQGSRTEAAAVRRIRQAIRREVQETLKITNYTKDGTPFLNVLTLHPVHDVAGKYRYSIGIQSDAARFDDEGDALAKLRSTLPTTVDHLQSLLSKQGESFNEARSRLLTSGASEPSSSGMATPHAPSSKPPAAAILRARSRQMGGGEAASSRASSGTHTPTSLGGSRTYTFDGAMTPPQNSLRSHSFRGNSHSGRSAPSEGRSGSSTPKVAGDVTPPRSRSNATTPPKERILRRSNSTGVTPTSITPPRSRSITPPRSEDSTPARLRRRDTANW